MWKKHWQGFVGAGLVAIAAVWWAIAYAATTPNTFTAAITPNAGFQTFVQGTDAAGTFKTVYTGQTNGSKCTALIENNADQTATHVMMVRVVHSAVNYVLATATTTTSSATLVFGLSLDLMSPANWPGLPRDDAGNPYIMLLNGDTLQVTFNTALTASAVINVYAVCSDF